jgi:hypothetical protein
MPSRTFCAAVACALLFTVAVPAQRRLPAPASIFGFEPGADNKLATYDQVVEYFKKVDAASDNVKLVEAGTSTQGRTYYFALVSSKKNLDRLDRYREIARKLAHPEGLSDRDARKLAHEGRAFVHIDGGLHSTEFAGPQHTPLLLDELLTRLERKDDDVEAMLDEVILMLWPTINPDGHQMTAEWHMQRAGTPDASEPMPALYQEFVGHDNNRDGYMLNMIESRVMEHTWRQWEPNIIYVHHQSAPFPTRIWLPPFAEPIALHTPYLVSRELNMIGMAIARRLESEGKVGATHMGSGYDAWYPGYVDYAPAFKNIPAFWTETQGRGPAPQETRRDQIAADMQRPQSLYSSPWLGGTWTLRDQVEYMKTASIATIEYAAKYKESLLYGRYLAGKAQISKGQTEAPYAYVVPRDQRDPVAAVEMLRRLAFAGVRVYRLTSAATIEGERFPEGTWVIPTDQEFAALAREVLDVQKYPEIRESPEGPLDQPYDAAGWTLPLSMGVRTIYLQTPLAEDVRRQMKLVAEPAGDKVTPSPYGGVKESDAQPFDSVPGIGFDNDPMARAIVPPVGRVTGTGTSLAVNPAENNAFKAINRAWKAGGTVRFDRGRYVVSGLSPAAQTQLVETLALHAERVTEPAGAGTQPRIGVFLANTSMDEGWTRWVLEQYEFPFTRVSGTDIQAGSLRDKVDVLLVTDEPQGVLQGGGGRGGRGPSTAPGAGGATGTDQGAANDARAAAIEAFVRGGGTLVCFNRSSAFAISRLELPIKDVTTGLNRQSFFVGTSLLNVTVDPAQRVMSGMPEKAAVFFSSSPAFETLDGFTGTVLARYPDDHVLASGFLLGQSVLAGKAAALDIPYGEGRVILLGFRPQWRGQPFGTFRVIFNALLSGMRLP